MIDFENLAAAMGELDEDTVKEILEAVASPEDADKAMEACQKGMDTVGKLFEEGEYFVGDLIYAGELMTDAVEVLKPYLAGNTASGAKTRMILCTVKDDLHDIGKNIVRSMLEANGFDVLDLGIDCPAAKIVETAKSENIKIVALSGVLTLALDSMKATVEAIKAAGLNCKVIIGGAPVSAEACKKAAHMAMWWNWQTRRTQNPLMETSCGFKSHHRHQEYHSGFVYCFLYPGL